MTAIAAPPDLTDGGVRNNNRTINLGPTGMRGWVYHVNQGQRRADTSESRQIQVTAVDNGSPAHGVLAPNDVILGADGTGAAPAPFSADARKSLALAIADAEARSPATLRLLRWRSGTTSTVEITLRTMGAYSDTAPYDCPKSEQILTEGAQWVFNNESSGRYSFGGLSLLASGNPDYLARVRNEARARVPNAATRAQMMSDERDATSMVTWERGHTLIFLAEYYLATGDEAVLPGVEAYAVNFAKNSSLFGTVGHIFADKFPDGSPNGPMGGVYGPVNSSGMPCFLGLLLARECGIDHPSIEPAIERSSRFFASYAGRGAIPYGEHEPSPSHEGNGRSGLAALCFTLEEHRADEGRFFAKMATAAPSEREHGHTGAFFHYLWAPIGAAVGGEAAAAEHFRGISWHLDLARRWNGAFAYDNLNGEGPDSGSQYHNFRMSTAALLVYALPLRELHITGRGHRTDLELDEADVAAAAEAGAYDPDTRNANQLITDTGSWSPRVRHQAAVVLGTHNLRTSQINLLHSIAENAAGPAHARAGACVALGRIGDAASARVLAGLLNNPENHVRYSAAEALRYLPNHARQSVLGEILAAAAETAKPWYPINDEDPLQFANGRLSTLLFYGGNAYGPRGILWNNISGVDRELLYPAIRASAYSPLGFTRNNLQWIYPILNETDMLGVADAVVDSVLEFAPSDRMFAFSVRQRGADLLERFDIAEGVPTTLRNVIETRAGSRAEALGTLEKYAASYTTFAPEPDVIGEVIPFLNATDGNAAQRQAVSEAAQAVLDAIAADSNPRQLTPLKSIESVTADNPELMLPANSAILRVTSHDHARGDSVFTWRKIHGPGAVSFSGNGTADGAESEITIQPLPGEYRFEVTMSDSRNLTEVTETVELTLLDDDGSLPVNLPPTSYPGTVSVKRGVPASVLLDATDPEGDELTFTITTPPAHGTISGTPPAITYTPDAFFSGDDSLVFEAMDPGGLTSSATITFTVLERPPEIVVYEPFDYPVVNDPVAGRLAGRDGGIGWDGPWANNTAGSNGGEAFIYDHHGNEDGLFGGNLGDGRPDWDGQVNNLPTRGGYAGLSDWSSQPMGHDRLNSHRRLARSAGEMAADNDGVLWLSAVWHLPDPGFHSSAWIALTSNNGYFVERGRTLNNSANGIGVGHGAELTGDGRLNPLFWEGGTQSTPHPDPNTNPVLGSNSDNIVILRLEFGESQATVSTWFFNENQEMTEDVFHANAVSATSMINPDTLDTLTFGTIRHGNAVNEIRIANTFHDVISGMTDLVPVAHAQTMELDQNAAANVALTGEDPLGGGLGFAVTRQPAHGSLTGQLPEITYSPDAGFVGQDRLTFTVTDADGLVDEAEITFEVLPSRYLLTVIDGSGDGEFMAGEFVEISAAPPPSGMIFDRWTGDSAGIGGIADVHAPQTTLAMPAAPFTLTATFRETPPPVDPLAIGGDISYRDGHFIHTFTSGADGSFEVVDGGALDVDVLVVAGGGGGGSSTAFGMAGGGGGGAGGLVYRSGHTITGTVSVVVGEGGSGGGSGNTPGQNGHHSSFGTLNALGGGGGSGGNMRGRDGGSGGGGRGDDGGSALQPVSPSGGHGHIGAAWNSNGEDGAGGGGGAGAPATAMTNAKVGGHGGGGLSFDIDGTIRYFAGGGGGGGSRHSQYGDGGEGGGGHGGNNSTDPAQGTPHTGGGGGGGNNSKTGANGGSGIVIVRYPTPLEEDDYSAWASMWPEMDLSDPGGRSNGHLMTHNELRLWGLDPANPANQQPIMIDAIAAPDAGFRLTYTRRSPEFTGAAYSVWTSSDLVDWSEDTEAIQEASAPDEHGGETVTVTPTAPPDGMRLFIRMRAEPNGESP